ncbi:hypothetical protein NDU88_002134 [Pleurodeles waltl]|uniref:Secreted protein n=1 Tax=Pleurodeles waltl TaxID=8319 RepID=A0AAV7VYG9_PLEWA|nr:hypothetical protein NDU88_002134 [Pleurodeles waltl]
MLRFKLALRHSQRWVRPTLGAASVFLHAEEQSHSKVESAVTPVYAQRKSQSSTSNVCFPFYPHRRQEPTKALWDVVAWRVPLPIIQTGF